MDKLSSDGVMSLRNEEMKGDESSNKLQINSSNLGNLQSHKGATTADITSAYKFKSGASSTALIKNSEQSACTYSRGSRIWHIVLTGIIIFHILLVLIMMFPIPKPLAFGLICLEAILLVVFAVDAIIGIRNLLKKKTMLDAQIYSILLRINMFNIVATILAAVLFVLGVVEIVMLREEDRFGTLSGG